MVSTMANKLIEEEVDNSIPESVPEHIAMIMDGNGRWAKQKKQPRIFGHKNALKAVRDTVEGAAEIGVKYLTLYAFSHPYTGFPNIF